MDLGSVAVLVIDLQNEYRAGGSYPVEDYPAVLANARTVVEAARAAALPVLHVQACAEEPAFAHLAADHRWGVAGTRGADVCAEVAPAPDETVVRKRWPSAFRDTALDATLKHRGIEELVVLGVWTDSCVKGTVGDAVAADYRVWLVKDACGSGTATMHRTAVLDMANRLYGGGVLATAEACRALRGEPHRAWRCTRPIEFPYTLATLDRLYEAL